MEPRDISIWERMVPNNETVWDHIRPHGIVWDRMESYWSVWKPNATVWDCMGTVRDHMEPYGTLMRLHKIYTDQMAEWYRTSASGSVDLGFDSESGQTKDYVA